MKIRCSTAQELFNAVGAIKPEGTDGEITTFVANSQYYGAICAIELQNPDAEKRMLDFVENNPGHVLLGSAYNQLGKIYYNKKNIPTQLPGSKKWMLKIYRWQNAICINSIWL